MYSLTVVITMENCKQILKFQTYDVKHFLLNSEAKKKIILLFPEMRVMRKISSVRPQIYFFKRFSGDILFSSLVFLLFLILVLLLLFFEMKNILTHNRLCGRVSDKNIFTRPISENKTTFFLALR